MGLKTAHRKKKQAVTKCSKEPRTWMDSLDNRPMDMRFRVWNVQSLHRVSSVMTVLRELPKYK
jgi:hypothetical protein